MNQSIHSEKQSSRAWDLRVRSALLISVTFFLLLTLFTLLTYFAIRGILIDRSSGEILSQLSSVAEQLSDSISTKHLNEIVAEHSSTGETQIHYLILRQSDGTSRTIFPTVASDPKAPSVAIALTLQPNIIKLGRARNDLRLLTAVRRGPYLVAASAEYYFLAEVEESIIRVFGISLVVGLLFSLAIGFGLSNLILQPLNLIIAAGERLAGLPLHDPERLPIPKRTLQFAKLATTINALLDERDNQVARVHQFTSDAAHELRTPLTVLKGELEVDLRIYASHKRSQKHDSEENRLPDANAVLLSELTESLESNLEEVEHLIRMVEDLLYLSSFDEHSESSADTCELAQTISEVVRRLRPVAESRDVQLDLNLTPQLLLAAHDRLSRLFYNLILNAIQYSNPNSTVTISEERSATSIGILIHNEGPAISAQDLAHLFDRFFRADRARTRSTGGAGLGLSIVKSICDAHGYEIDVSSSEVFGTTFCVTIPIGG